MSAELRRWLYNSLKAQCDSISKFPQPELPVPNLASSSPGSSGSRLAKNPEVTTNDQTQEKTLCTNSRQNPMEQPTSCNAKSRRNKGEQATLTSKASFSPTAKKFKMDTNQQEAGLENELSVSVRNQLVTAASFKWRFVPKVPRTTSHWLPPYTDYLTWNVCGSSLAKPGTAGIGGVLLNTHGHFLGLFSCPVSVLDSNHAEVKAIRCSLEISLTSDAVKGHKLVIVSDSSNAIAWITNQSSRPRKLQYDFDAIDLFFSSQSNISFLHCNCEGNSVADALAKQALSRREDFFAWC